MPVVVVVVAELGLLPVVVVVYKAVIVVIVVDLAVILVPEVVVVLRPLFWKNLFTLMRKFSSHRLHEIYVSRQTEPTSSQPNTSE